MDNKNKDLLKNLPKVDFLLGDPRIKPLIIRYPKRMVTEEIRRYLKDLRVKILESQNPETMLEYDTIVNKFVEHVEVRLQRGVKRAINGVGIILHTGLGRAPFCEQAQQALMDAVTNYCLLQIDQESGKRGERNKHVANLLCQITGAEAAIIVNNNAAATLLVLNTLASGKEVIVSRGELVEIGGSFRIPDVMARSGAKLVEVGTTNRTHLKDYEAALTPETGVILHVHKSNYAIIGFTKEVPLQELAELAHAKGLLLFDDLGSGALVDFSNYGLPKEPTVQESLKAGADIVCFSGDKLIGGPQCGIIIGKKEIVERVKKNQLVRALRCDKMTYAVLEATLQLFLDERVLLQSHPVIRMMTEPVYEIKKRCMALKRKIKVAVGEKAKLRLAEEQSEVGSGSLSTETIPTWALSIKIKDMTPDTLAMHLRLSNPPVFGRVKEDQFLLDCRTIRQDELNVIVKTIEQILEHRNKN